jgi:hypothetical protein
MITNKLKMELFTSNLAVMEQIIKELAKNIDDAKQYLVCDKNSEESNLNAVIGSLLSIPKKLKQLEEMKNVMENVNELKSTNENL